MKARSEVKGKRGEEKLREIVDWRSREEAEYEECEVKRETEKLERMRQK